jgi:hypothetical protein
MQLFIPLKHADELLNAARARLGLDRCLNPPEDGVSIGAVQGSKEGLGAGVARKRFR